MDTLVSRPSFARALLQEMVERRIPRADMTAVETPKSWLGKSVGTTLLCVRWQEDAMAWEVRDLDAWLAALSSDPRA